MTLATRLAVFHKGVLQQVGAPLDLYRAPANRFVAGFLGSPAMNFLPARVQGGRLVGKGFSLPAPAGAPEGREVVVGARPQAVRLAGDGELKGEIEAVERLGPDGFVYLKTAAGPVIARFEGAPGLTVGERAAVAIDPREVLLFDPQDDRALAGR